MLAARGRVQREGEVLHLAVHRIVDLSRDLASVGQRKVASADRQVPKPGPGLVGEGLPPGRHLRCRHISNCGETPQRPPERQSADEFSVTG